MRRTILKPAVGPLAIVMLFALGRALLGLGINLRLGDREDPTRTLLLEEP
jgi:hypothetical protein